MVLSTLLTKAFGSSNSRTIRRLQQTLAKVNKLEAQMQQLSAEELKGKFAEFQTRHQNGESLTKLLPEAFAVVREGGVRFLQMRHFDVQILGGLALFEGNIAEMKTGEGKTLVATLPVYLHALAGKGVHLITVNEYLAKRDAEWMGKLYEGLGLSVGVIYAQQPRAEKKAAYAAEVTYGTNNEFGFDYLRDNLVLRQEDKVQRESFNYAIVDEVDSILIDEARTPLIISGPNEEDVELYRQIDQLIPPLKRQLVREDGEVTTAGDFVIDEKLRSVEVTELGHEHLEQELAKLGILPNASSLYDSENLHLLHHVQAALKAHHLFKRNVAYLIQGGQVVIVDEHTGRSMPGRRWSEGIHQAIEAKEGLEVQQDNQTMASTTFQNYFRLYDTLAGMTGTADTEAYEFHQIYGLEVIVIPSNKELCRADLNDTVYMTSKEKFAAIVADIAEQRQQERPVLVGTASVENSEVLAGLLAKQQIPHKVLNAKNHSAEAEIIAEAGRPGAVTIATNMAGRGTDIVLGGNLESELQQLGEDASEQELSKLKAEWQTRHELVLKNGGLHVIGSERHESRRIDNQLRGRSGRQGDPGSSHFYLSLDDDLLRLFTPERIIKLMRSLGVPAGEPIEHSMITKSIERAQRKVEGRNFDLRKQLLEYDDVVNNQRSVIYQQRNEIMAAAELHEAVRENIAEQIQQLLMNFEETLNNTPEAELPQLTTELQQELRRSFAFNLEAQRVKFGPKEVAKLAAELPGEVYANYQQKLEDFSEDMRASLEKQVMLQVLDNLWRRNLQALEHLRQEIYLRGYAQRNPKEEYKKEAYSMFDKLLERIKADTVRILCSLQIKENPERLASAAPPANTRTEHQTLGGFAAAGPPTAAPAADGLAQPAAAATPPPGIRPRPAPPPRPVTQVRQGEKIGRNQPCPCGSGKKYKHCHGKPE